jgi:Tol biopolymer transport system component
MPAVSPDSKWIAYSHDSGANDDQGIWIMRIDGSGARQLTHGYDLFPDWQPLQAPPPVYNGEIAFTRVPDGDYGQLFTVNPDGTSPMQRTTTGGAYPSFDGSGSQVAYVGAGGISVMDADGSGDHVVIPGQVFHGFRLSWSPDGARFVTIESVNEFATITIQNTDGTDKRHLFADDAEHEFNPAWSRDGTKLVFDKESKYYEDPNPSGIWIADADGSNAHNIAPGTRGMTFPSFSPDGTKVAFPDNGAVMIVNSDGTNLHAVGTIEGYAAFSPDGQWLAVMDESSAHPGIWIERLDGSDARQITHGHDLFPDWQPRQARPANLAPHAVGTAQNKSPLALFGNGDPSWDFDGTIVSYEWRWGDNTAMTPKKYAWHKYAKAGTYLVRLTVTDNDGAKTTKKAWVKVN